MAKNQSIAPKERVNITYRPATGDVQEDVELPLKILSIGDYTGRPDDRPLEEREPISIDKDNFNKVLAEHKLSVDLQVPDALTEEEGAEMAVHLKFESLKDFTPEGVAAQVPQLQRLIDLREALTALKGPLGNLPAFRKKMQSLVGDAEKRLALKEQLLLNEKND